MEACYYLLLLGHDFNQREAGRQSNAVLRTETLPSAHGQLAELRRQDPAVDQAGRRDEDVAHHALQPAVYSADGLLPSSLQVKIKTSDWRLLCNILFWDTLDMNSLQVGPVFAISITLLMLWLWHN